MKVYYIVALMIFSSLISAAKKNSVFVSIPSQKYVVEQVAGKLVGVSSLLSEDDNPHTFTVSPKTLKKISSSQIYFMAGIPFEAVIISKLADSGLKLQFARMDEQIKRRHMLTEHECSSGCAHSSSETDPHYWIAPLNLAQMADSCCKKLSDAWPEHKNVFKKNLELFRKRMIEIDATLKKEFKPFHGHSFYVYHPAFGYFADTCGIKQKAVEVSGRKPSPRQLSKLIAEAKTDRVKTIVVQNQFDRRSAERLAQSIGGEVVEINPMQANVEELLETLAQTVKKGFVD